MLVHHLTQKKKFKEYGGRVRLDAIIITTGNHFQKFWVGEGRGRHVSSTGKRRKVGSTQCLCKISAPPILGKGFRRGLAGQLGLVAYYREESGVGILNLPANGFLLLYHPSLRTGYLYGHW